MGFLVLLIAFSSDAFHPPFLLPSFFSISLTISCCLILLFPNSSLKSELWIPANMDGGAAYNPRTVEEVFRDFKGRRAGMIRALTTGLVQSPFSFSSSSISGFSFSSFRVFNRLFMALYISS